MCAIMDDAVHIQIQTIELWDPIFCNQLGDGWISLAEPSEEFGNPHDCQQMTGKGFENRRLDEAVKPG